MTVRMRLITFLFIALAAGLVTACSGGDSATATPTGIQRTDPVPNPTATPEPVVTTFEGKVQQFEVNLAINGSPQQGTAVFTRVNDYVRIEIRLSPGAPAQTVTLRRGRCPNPVGFEETLNLAIGGVMRQEIRNMPFDDLLSGDHTLVVSVNDDEFNTLAACADLPAAE